MKLLQLVLGLGLLLAVDLKSKAFQTAQLPRNESIKLWDTASGKARDISLEQEDITSLAFSPNGNLLAVGSANKGIDLWDLHTARRIGTLAGHKGAVQTLSFSPDGLVLASGSWDRTIKLWSITTRKQIGSLTGNEAEVLSVVFSPTGQYLASGGGDEKVRLWNLSTKRIAHTLARHVKRINSVAFSFDGKLLATGSDDKTIEIWEVETGQLVSTLAGHFGPVRSVAFNPHNHTLASSSEDQTIKIWDSLSRKEILTLKGHLSSVDYVAFSPNGKTLATGSYDKTVRLWDVTSGSELRTLEDHPQRITSIAFSPDGKTLASTSAPTGFESPTLHLLAIGVTSYHNGSIQTVDFASKDARDFAAGLEKAASTKFERINISLLTDFDASQTRISSAISKIVDSAKPQDVFVLFFAGHASMALDSYAREDRFGLLPADGLRITDVLLRSWLTQIEARQQLIILETRDSTRGYESFIKDFADENQLLRGLLKRHLVVLVNAFQAPTPPKLKNRFLTHSLLEGLAGGAALESGELTANSLVEYTKRAHSALSKDLFRRVGEIKTFTVGQDFELAHFPRAYLPPKTGAYVYASLPFETISGSRSLFAHRSFIDTARTFHPHTSKALESQQKKSTSPQARLSESEFKRRGKDYALFIATDNYRQWRSLGNPIRDATAVAETLRNYYGFKTEVVKDPTLSDVATVLEKYINQQYEDGDQLFIFVAGHGHYIQNTRQGYLVFADSLSVQNDRIGSTYLSYPILRNLVDNIPCKHIFLVIDACYSGTFDEAIARRGLHRSYADAPLPQFIEAKMQYTTRKYIASAGSEPVYDGDKGKHSPFTSQLLESLRTFGGQAGYLTIASIAVNLHTLTPAPISDKWGQDDPGSDFFFIAKKP